MSVIQNNLTATTILQSSEAVSVDRPVIIDFEYTGSGDVPVICEVQAFGFRNNLFTSIGAPLFANKTSDSTDANPKFRLDFSDVMASFLGDTFKKTNIIGGNVISQFPPTGSQLSNAKRDLKVDYGNQDAAGMGQYKFYGFAWCVDEEGILNRTTEDGVLWSLTHFVNPVKLSFSPDFVSNGYSTAAASFTNLEGASNSTVFGVSDLSGTVKATATASFTTNVPRGLTRKIKYNSPAPFAILTINQINALDAVIKINMTKASDNSSLSKDTTVQHTTVTGNNFTSYLATPILQALDFTAISNVNQVKSNYSYTFDVENSGGSDILAADTLNFQIVAEGNIGEFEEVRRNARSIYWINDFNVLDYYLFDGGIEIKYENKKVNFVRNKDYSIRRDSNYGVLKGTSTEIITVFTEAMNKESMIWLQEIGRSTAVYEFDETNQVFIPIVIEDFNTVVLDSVSKNAYSVEISYKRNVISSR